MAPSLSSKYDPSSLSNIDKIKTTHSHLNLAPSFQTKSISAFVVHQFSAIADNIASIELDTSFLNIKGAEYLVLENKNLIDVVESGILDHQVSDTIRLRYELRERDPLFGQKLIIHLPNKIQTGESVIVKITYETTPKSTAIQWLNPSQTAGKIHPYLFTQCQAIHARSLLPCQDSPSIKITYSSTVTVPSLLTAVMSALELAKFTFDQNGDKVFRFKQPCAMPCYLIALAVGNLVSADIGPRSRVFSEPEVIQQAEWEFSDTETFITTGESLLTPYSWTRYDLLVLPSSFPYGGMENPCLTFVTPSLLAGDRSLVDVVAHEIAHSWMGNLVTTMNWEHFWLNEGFTMLIERKIIERMHGKGEADFSAIIGLKALQESVDLYAKSREMDLTRLVPTLNNVDPDDAFSSIPYEKGFNFLVYLETLLGGPKVFEPFLRAYVTEFAGKSIQTSDFKSFLLSYFRVRDISKISMLDSVDWDTWFYGYGMPPIVNKFDQSLVIACQELADRWDAARLLEIVDHNFKKSDIASFTASQKVVFLEKLLEKDPLSTKLILNMEKVYEMSSYSNAEIRFRWQCLCLESHYEHIFPDVVKFITSIGRMKYVRPLYRSLSKCGQTGMDLAKATFFEYKEFYHPICGMMVAKDLGVDY